ncbi:MAG: hypothetical protein K6F73_01465 [Lachnospiraceae bacterium]|nr:hypothetical protein [Lachnospiraceae bacterium]
MKYVNRELKGTWGYIRKQRIFEIVKTVVLFAMALGIFFIGYFTLGTKKSLWSVLAVLALLPACKSAVGVIMLMRFSSLPDDVHERFVRYTEGIPTVFENILTTSSRTFYLQVISCMAATVIAYGDIDKKDIDQVREHIEYVLKTAGHKASVKIFTDEEGFAARAAELREKLSDQGSSSELILSTIKAVSL